MFEKPFVNETKIPPIAPGTAKNYSQLSAKPTSASGSSGHSHANVTKRDCPMGNANECKNSGDKNPHFNANPLPDFPAKSSRQPTNAKTEKGSTARSEREKKTNTK